MAEYRPCRAATGKAGGETGGSAMRLAVLDHTLGQQTEPGSLLFSADDRLAIARRLDRLGIDLIEAGAPASDRKAREFFERARQECRLTHAELVASARMDGIREALSRDTGVQAVVDALTPVIALEGCCWHAGPVGLQEYCRRISETVRYFQSKGRRVIFRAEDFFDGYCTDPSFALRMLEAAKLAGADVLCLADSAGGTLPRTTRANWPARTRWKPSSRASPISRARWRPRRVAAGAPTCMRSFPTWSAGSAIPSSGRTTWRECPRWRDSFRRSTVRRRRRSRRWMPRRCCARWTRGCAGV